MYSTLLKNYKTEYVKCGNDNESKNNPKIASFYGIELLIITQLVHVSLNVNSYMCCVMKKRLLIQASKKSFFHRLYNLME